MRKIYLLLTLLFLVITANIVQANPTVYKESDFTEQELALSGLNPAQKELVLKIINNNHCVCGCSKDTWAECFKADPNCPITRPTCNKVAEFVKAGKSEEFILGYFAGLQEGLQKGKSPKKEEDPNKIYQFDTMNAPIAGPANALVTVIEYTDYQCPYCKMVQGALKATKTAYADKVRFIAMNNPLSFHPNAMPAAMAARAAGKQGKFWEMHDLIFENAPNLDDANIVKMAEKLGLNIEKFNVDRQDEELKKEILKEQEQTVKQGAGGTPVFFINGKKLSGAKPFSDFKAAIDNALEEAAAKPAEKK